jgi:phosphatidylethanolamine/phosphatidyl-N-methylethanolamine N-methyltransferase
MKTLANDLRFLRGFLSHPLSIASPLPSGPRLAAAVAAHVGPIGSRSVLELGPGTGAVTQAILARGLAPERLVAIESEPDFVGLLKRRFPQSEIIAGDAFAFAQLLPEAHQSFDAIVSGLPIVGKTKAARRQLLTLAMTHLRPGGTFVQFSYAPWSPFPSEKDVRAQRAATVWSNLPPMHIWTYRRR